MNIRTSLLVGLISSALACSGPAKAGPDKPPAKPPAAPTKPDSKPAAPKGPVSEKAATLREAASLLEKAAGSLADGNKFLAEQQFSFAEQLVGDAAVASIAPMFREGAPPKVTTPLVKVENTGPQPKVNGSSEADDEAAKVPPPPALGSLTGTLMINDKAAGTYGLVTLEPATGKWKPRTPKRVTIEQRDREFRPSLVAVSVGSTISFPNFDTVFHNVFSSSQLAAFDLGLYKSGEAREYTFNKEGFIRLGCNLHANMSAYIAVVSAPAYVVTDDKGAFSFKRLAPGKYKLKAWSVKSKEPITQDVTIKSGANSVNPGVAADAPQGPPPNKFGGKRG